jgi:hypothetical protein
MVEEAGVHGENPTMGKQLVSFITLSRFDITVQKSLVFSYWTKNIHHQHP